MNDVTFMADAVVTRDDFLRFVQALLAEYLEMQAQEKRNPSSPWGASWGGWENITLDRFLEAMHAWAVDNQIAETPTWRLMAQLLVGGKTYE